MSPLLPMGLAVAINAALFGVGFIWIKRRTGRVKIERKEDYRGLFRLEPLSPPGDEVKILVEEDDGRTTEIEGVHWPAIGWTDAVTLLPVEGDVLGWRERPFRRKPPAVDYSGWTDEQVAAEIERRFGDVERR